MTDLIARLTAPDAAGCDETSREVSERLGYTSTPLPWGGNRTLLDTCKFTTDVQAGIDECERRGWIWSANKTIDGRCRATLWMDGEGDHEVFARTPALALSAALVAAVEGE